MKTIKTKSVILIVVLVSITIITQAQNWQWAKHVGSISPYDNSGKVITDQSGNSYATGSFQYLCYFDNDSLYPSNNHGIFLVKYDNNGTQIWINQLGGANNAVGVGDICMDPTNTYIYATGNFIGTAIFGSTTLTNSGFYLAKFDLNGNCIWAKQSIGLAIGNSVTTDNSGNVYVCGINLISATFGSYTIPGGGFIAKYDGSGNCLWAKQKFRLNNPSTYGSEVQQVGIKIYNSNIIIGGSCANDTIIVDTITVYSSSSRGILLASFNLNGDVQWLKTNATNNTLAAGSSGISIDNQGNSYIAGAFGDSAYFGGNLLTSSIDGDAILVKFDINGHFKWVKQLNSTAGAMANNIFTNGDGYSYVTGYFSGTAHFGGYTITAASAKDMFVARYDSSGVCLGVKNIGQNFGQANGTGVCSDGNSFWVTGTFSSNTVTIGSTTFTRYGNSNGYTGDIFTAKCAEITKLDDKMLSGSTKNTLTIYANPNKGICNITVPQDLLHEENLVLKIYDTNGKLIQQQPVQVDQEKVKINIEAEATGIYNVTLGNKNKVYSGKIVFE